MPVFLITDVLVWIFVLFLLFFLYHIKQHPDLMTTWKKVFRRPIACVAMLILLIYGFAGVLDSIHFRQKLEDTEGVTYSSEITSVFDLLLTRLNHKTERTYSAPFASYSYIKSQIIEQDGTIIHDYERLLHGGAHLQNPEIERHADILRLGLQGLIFGMTLSAILVILLLMIIAWRQHAHVTVAIKYLINHQYWHSWLAVLTTTVFLIIIICMCYVWSGYYYILGTDKVGQDVLYQALKSIRTGLIIGSVTTLIMLPFALALGLMAGYLRGWVDDIIQYIYTTLNSIPGVLLIAASVLLLDVYMNSQDGRVFTTLDERADLRLLILCIILGITSWTGLCRLLRAEALKIREMDYVQVATGFGVRHFYIIRRHFLPNVMHIVMIAIVLDFSTLVLAEALLSYINIGVDPSTYSWGNMINSARLEIARDPVVWWTLSAAFFFMFFLVLAANLFADALRDAFDPRFSIRH